MKIAIVGAGISGCAVYLALKKHLPSLRDEEHEYTIYEAYDTPRNKPSNHEPGNTHSASLVVGGGIGLGPNGLNVLKRLDQELFHDVVRAGYPYAFQQMKSAHGWNLMRTPSASGNPPVSSISMSRHALWNCLRNRVPDNVIVNRRILQIVAVPHGRNVIKFADGSPDVEADLIIGADGLKSTARRALFPEATDDPFPPHYEYVVLSCATMAALGMGNKR
jgi:2-polyprenyl-6-methoxyphenol hydroxylase-like FAD-dependent oxidoreductase